MRRVGLVVAAGCLVLAGCGGTPERADTLPEPAGSSTAAQSKKAVAVPKVDDGLTAVQVKAALLSLDDMPTGWAQEKATPDNGKEPKITPAECAAVGAAAHGEPMAKAEAKFSAGGFGPTLEQSIASWGQETAGMIVKAKTALAKCRKFTTTLDGDATTFEVAGLSFPNVGDRTLAVRMTTKAKGLDATFDVVYVALGKNSMSLIAGGLQPVDGGSSRRSLARLCSMSRMLVSNYSCSISNFAGEVGAVTRTFHNLAISQGCRTSYRGIFQGGDQCILTTFGKRSTQ